MSVIRQARVTQIFNINFLGGHAYRPKPREMRKSGSINYQAHGKCVQQHEYQSAARVPCNLLRLRSLGCASGAFPTPAAGTASFGRCFFHRNRQVFQRFSHLKDPKGSFYGGCPLSFFLLFLFSRLLFSFWTSRGHRCRPFYLPSRYVPSFLSRGGFSIPNARRCSSKSSTTSHCNRAFRGAIFAQEVPTNVIRVCTRGGLEPSKSTVATRSTQINRLSSGTLHTICLSNHRVHHVLEALSRILSFEGAHPGRLGGWVVEIFCPNGSTDGQQYPVCTGEHVVIC